MNLLHAINKIITSSGLSQIASENTNNPHFTEAQALLLAKSSELQTRGWWFNKRTIELTPDAQGRLKIPTGVLSIDATDRRIRVTKRGEHLYDYLNNTDVFSEPLLVNVILLVPFLDLPESAQICIANWAAYTYFRQKGGVAQDNGGMLAEDAQRSEYLLRGENLRNMDLNVSDSPAFRVKNNSYYTGGINSWRTN